MYNFIRQFSSSSTPNTWRIQAQNQQLISQITSILLQRHNWPSLLKTLNLSSQITPQIFHQVLNKIQSNPQISLSFFNWVKSNFVGFQPDIKAQCRIIQVVIGSGRTNSVKEVLDSLIEVCPPTRLVHSMVYACKGRNLHSVVFSEVIESYALKGLYVDGLEVYNAVTRMGSSGVSVGCLNVMLDVLDKAGEFKLVYCLFGSMFRNGVLVNDDTLGVVARVCSKSGKFDSVVRLLDCGVCNEAIFELVIDGYSRIGRYEVAFDYVSEMCRRNFEPGFCTYGSILNGACEFGELGVIDTVLCTMTEKGFIPRYMLLGYDDVVVKFCELGKIYAAEFMFKRAGIEGVKLKDSAFGCMLSAYCKGEKVNEAIELYRVILKENIFVLQSCYQEFADSLCTEKPREDIIQLLMDLIKRGFNPSVSNISKFMMKLGREQRWEEVEALMDVMLKANLLPDSGFCSLLVNRYFSSRKIDSVLMLHDKVGKSEGSWDVTTYNVLLRALFMEKRVNEAVDVFECMKMKCVVNEASCLIMINGLSKEKEMRKALQVHDDMLKLGLKPSPQKYKSLISVFR